YCAPNRAIGLRDLLVVAEAYAGDVHRSLQCRQQFAHAQRIPFSGRVAAVRRGGAFLADEGSGGALAAGHAVDGVVDEDSGDVFATVGGVQDLGGSNRRQVAVSLVADEDAVGMTALDGRAYGGGASMRRLHIAHVEVVVR